jgi:hypothetical protein
VPDRRSRLGPPTHETPAIVSPRTSQLRTRLNAAATSSGAMAYLDGLPPAQQREALSGLTAAEQVQVTSAIRRGEGSDLTRLAVSLNRLEGTAWGRAHRDELRNLEAMHSQSGGLSFGTSVNGWGVSDAGRITFNEQLRTQPEALSAFMAHEGTHARQPRTERLMDAELGAHVAQSEVWREVHGPETATAATRQLDGHLAALGQNRDHLAYQIASDYFRSPTTSREQQTDIQRYCLSHPGIAALMDP